MESETEQLRREVAKLRRDLDRVLDFLNQRDEPDYPRPDYGSAEFEQLCVRCDKHRIPLSLHANQDEGVVALYDDNRCLRAELGVYSTGQAGLTIYNDQGEEIVFIGKGEDGGGLIGVRGADGTPRACIRTDKQDGVVSVVSPQGDSLAFMRGTEKGGMIAVLYPQKTTAVVMRAEEQGGMMTLHEPSGQLMAHVTVTSIGGLMTLHGEQGMPGATLSACGSPAGVLVLYDVDGEPKGFYPS